MNKLIYFILVMLLAAACTPNDPNTPNPGLIHTSENTFTPTPLPTATSTLAPTATHTPTATATEAHTPTPDVVNQNVKFLTDDGLTIIGTQFGEGEVAVILTHMGEAGSNSRASWFPFARHVAALGKFTTLSIDLRGYGSTGGQRSFNEQYLDVLGAINFLQERGFEKIICMGASMGGNACVEAALVDPELVGLAIIASNPRLDRDYSQLTMPKLFVLEEGDPYQLTAIMEAVYAKMPEPKAYHTFPEDVHGTRMFETPSGDKFRQLLVDFLESIAQ